MTTTRDPHDVSAVLSVGKALAVVEALLQAHTPLSAREIGARSRVNRTTAHRLLNTLILHGWVERAGEGGYRLATRFLALAHVSVQVRGLFDEIRPALVPLSELSRETVHVGVLDGFDIVHVDKIESLEHVGVSSRIGTRGVTHRTALGKAMLAASPDAFVAAYIAQGRERDPPYRVERPDAVWDAVGTARKAGYSVDDEDDSVGVRCLGAAVRGVGDHPIFAISITGPSPRFTLAACQNVAPTLLSIACELSHRFGGGRGIAGVREREEGAHDAA